MKLYLTICRASEVVGPVKAQEQNGNPFTAVISIEHPCDETTSTKDGRAPRLSQEIGPEWADRQLILSCWDIEESLEDTPAPDSSVVQSSLTHFDRCRPSRGDINLLAHCRSGKARSTAIALILSRYNHGAGTEQECLDHLLRIRPIAAPNLAIVRHGDEILKCNGSLTSVVEHHPGITLRRAEANRARAHQIESRRMASRLIL